MKRVTLFLLFTVVVMGLVYAAPGDLDQSFARDGKAFTSFSSGTDSEALDAVLDPFTGKITLAGYVYNESLGSTHIALARFNSDGRIDSTFGSGGKVDQSFGYLDIWANAIARQSDGKLVVAGDTDDSGGIVARFNANGTVDSTFGINGLKTISGGGINDVAIQSDGRIVIVYGIFGTERYDFAVTRLNSNGSIDTYFGVQGTETIDFFGFNDHANAVSIQSDGKIVVCGKASQDISNDTSAWAVVRLFTNGWKDWTFDADGKITYDWSSGVDTATSVAIQTDGQIVVLGVVNDATFGLVRFSSSGAVGFSVINNFPNYDQDWASSVRVAANGRIITGGTVYNFVDEQEFAVACHLDTGTLDTSFGKSGRVTTDMWTEIYDDDTVYKILLQKDAKIIAVGTSTAADGHYRFAVARYLGCGV